MKGYNMNEKKVSRAGRLKNKIRDLGCSVRFDSYTKEITVRHKDLKEVAFVSYTPRDRASIEEALEECVRIAENFAVYFRMQSAPVEDRQTFLIFESES